MIRPLIAKSPFWMLVLAVLGLVALRLFYMASIGRDIHQFVPTITISMLLIAAGRAVGLRWPAFKSVGDLIAALGLAILTGVAAGHTAALAFYSGRHFAMVDDWLMAADRALGFDWEAYVRWVDQHRMAEAVLLFAYNSWVWTTYILIAVLSYRQASRLWALIAAMAMTLTVTQIVAMFFPCLGPYGVLPNAAAFHPNGPLFTQDHHVALIEWLRRGDWQAPRPASSGALISFPSFHATTAVLLAWGTWRSAAVIKYPMAVINALMLVATPVEGSHYLVDVLAGIALAVAAVPLVSRWFDIKIDDHAGILNGQGDAFGPVR